MAIQWPTFVLCEPWLQLHLLSVFGNGIQQNMVVYQGQMANYPQLLQLVLLIKMLVPNSPTSNIQQTYCVPLRDTKIGFKTPKIHVKADRENIIITLFKNQKNLAQQPNNKNNNFSNTCSESYAQTNIQAAFEKFIYNQETKIIHTQAVQNGSAQSEYFRKQKVTQNATHCNVLVQSMLTGKLMDSFEESTNLYIHTLQLKMDQYENETYQKKPKQLKIDASPRHYSPTVCHFQLSSTETQTSSQQIINLQISSLDNELKQVKGTLNKLYDDNITLIQIKKESELTIKNQQLQITELHANISRLTLQNSRMKSNQLLVSRNISEEPVREKSSLNFSKKSRSLINDVKTKQLETLREENKILRQYIEAAKAGPAMKLFSRQSVKNKQQQNSFSIDIIRLKEEITRLQYQNGLLKQQHQLQLGKSKSLQQRLSHLNGQMQERENEHNQQINSLKEQIDKMSSELQKNDQKKVYCQNNWQQPEILDVSFNNEDRFIEEEESLQQKVKTLSSEIRTEKELYNIIKGQNQRLKLQLNKPKLFKEEEYSKLNYKRLEEMHKQQSNQLRNSEFVIKNLREIIKQYQILLDQNINDSEEYEDKTVQNLSCKINQYTNFINSKISCLQDYFKSGTITDRNSEVTHCMDQIFHEFKKERTKRMFTQNKLERLSQTLMQYEEQIIEKTATISDLNFAIIQLQDKSQQNSFCDDYSSAYFSKSRYQNKTSPNFRRTKYDRTPIQHNPSEEQTINESKIRNSLEESFRQMKISNTFKRFRAEDQTLKSLLSKKCLSEKEKTFLILQMIQTLQKNLEAWRCDLTPANFIIKSNKKGEVFIDLCANDKDSLYCSPEQLHEMRSESSGVWRMGVIIDEIIHGSLFFEDVQSIIDPKDIYKFRSKNVEHQGISKFLVKAVIKNPNMRISMPKFLAGLKFQYKFRCY